MNNTIWLAYVSYPVTTAVYIERALRRNYKVYTMGPTITKEYITEWNLHNMKLEIKDHDFRIHPEADMKQLTAHLRKEQFPSFYLWVESVYGYFPVNLDSLDCPKACYLIDTHLNLNWHLEWAKNFDYVFLAQREYIRHFHQAGMKRVYWLPLACDPEIHRRSSNIKKHDIGFVGSVEKGSRRDFLLSKISKKFNIHIERCFWDDMARVFSESRIVFNNAVRNDLNMRVFEVMSTGSLLLTDSAPESGLTELFVDGEDLVIYEDYNLLEKAEYYLNNESLRKTIAERGMLLVHNAHTYMHRCEDLINVITGRTTSTPDAKELRERSIPKTVIAAPAPTGEIDAQDIAKFDIPYTKKRSFIIPVLDMMTQTGYNFETLLNDLQKLDGEVIVVFNSVVLAEKYKSHPVITHYAVMSHNVGVSRAWNIGLHLSSSPVAFILNADVHITLPTVEAIENAFQVLPDSAVIGPEGGFFDFSRSEDIQRFRKGAVSEPIEVDNVSGFLFAVQTKYFHSGRLIFENKFTPCYFEEWDLGMQLRFTGLKGYVVPCEGYDHDFNSLHRKGDIDFLGERRSLQDILERNHKYFWSKWLNIARDNNCGEEFFRSKWYDYNYLLAEKFYAQGKKELALEQMFIVLKYDMNDLYANYRAAEILIELGSLKQAVEYFRTVHSVNPSYKKVSEYLNKLN